MLMESTVESGWALALPLAAKCGSALVANPSRLLAIAAAVILVWLVSLLLQWTSPGGSAWGKYWWSSRARRPGSATIPGPRGFPLLGSMHLMAGLAHQKLAATAEACGAKRLMAFTLGETRAVVTCDPDVAREILCSPDFADRPAKESAYELMFHRSIGFAPYGAYWRVLRRITANHLFSARQTAAFMRQRTEIAAEMVSALATSVDTYTLRPRDVLKRASLNNIMWSVFGRRYKLGEEGEELRELLNLVEEGYDLLGKTNWSDHLPGLAGFDLQGIRSRCSRIVPRVNRFVERIIDEHKAARASENYDGEAAPPDFVDVLLSLEGSDRLTDADIVAVLWEMIFRGTDTVAVLIEWVLARLVLHGEVQAKVHEELDAVVGRHRPVTESDTGSLVYLQAVIKETLRVHPPGPLLSWARMSLTDVYIDGRLVPAGTTAMVNMWAITHDPAVWLDPLEFRPERFVGPDAAESVVLGSDLRLAPFGSGRRGCPGKSMAMATVTLWVATLMNGFEWRPAADDGTVDLTEELRLSCEMAAPLATNLMGYIYIFKFIRTRPDCCRSL